MLRFHALGDWSPGHVTSTWVADGRRRVAEVDAAIETAWAAAGSRPGVHLFDGPMCRLESWHATATDLRLVLSPTSYKPFVGTNMANPQLADAWGRNVMANPVGVSTTLLTVDGQLMLGRRNASVAYYPGRTHTFAGSLEPADADVFAAVRRELSEELLLSDADLFDIRCTGIAEDVALRQPELMFSATTAATRSQVESQLDADEHVGTWSIGATAEAIEATVQSERARLTPVAIGALLLWGRLKFGDGWFSRVSAPVLPATAEHPLTGS